MSELHPAAGGPVSRIEWVERELRRAILGGEYEPGQRLRTVSLAESYSVSPTPLREVLQRFAGEGLVDFTPQKGARVSQLTVRDALELAEVRKLLDAALLSGAAEQYQPHDLKDIEVASRLLRGAWQRDGGHSRGAEITYRAFFDRAAQPNPSLRLRRMASLTRELGSRYRLAAGDTIPVDDLLRWHDRFLAAVRAASPTLVADAIKLEVDGFAAAFVATHPDPAAAS